MISILLVNAHPSEMLKIKTLLEAQAYNIVTSGYGEEVLQRIMSPNSVLLIENLALAIIDTEKYHTDGFETAKLIRANKKIKNVPIIFILDKSFVLDINKKNHFIFKDYQSGLIDYIFKPVADQILKNKVKVFAELFQRKIALENITKKLELMTGELENKNEQLSQKQKLEDLGKLVGGVAHEINNPISFVLSHLRRILRKMPNGTDELLKINTDESGNASKNNLLETLEEAKNSIQISIEGCFRIADIVKDLSNFARTDIAEKLSEFNINELLSKVLSLAKHEINMCAILSKDFGKTDNIVAKESKIFQVFINLITNAIYAIGDGKPNENYIKVRSWMDNNEVLVEIKDTGCGISSDVMDKIFNPFFTTKPAGLGTGRGLNICFSIIESHGGTIEVESALKVGSKFVIHLPLNSENKNKG